MMQAFMTLGFISNPQTAGLAASLGGGIPKKR